MRYPKLKKTKLTILIISLFMLFSIGKFIKVRITSVGLPKGKIVFSSYVDGDSEIYTMNINGTGLRQLTHNSATKRSTATDDEASFSNDGKRIVFKSSRAERQNYRIITDTRGRSIGEEYSGGSTDIYIMDSDCKNQLPLTYNTLSSDPFFSPDAKKIIFTTLLKNRHTLVKLINIDGSGERILNFGGGQVEFSSDGKKIFDNFQSDVSVADISGADRKRLTHLNDDKESKLGIHFVISPDDKRLAFITIETRKLSRPDNIDDFYDIFDFYTMNIDGSGLEKIYRIDGSALDELYVFSEQRSWEGFATGDERLPDGTVRKKIYNVSDLKGVRGILWQCRFSPDGKYLIFRASFRYKEGIYLLNLENKKAINLTNEKEKWDEFLDFTFTPDGKRIVFVAGIAPEIYYSKAKPVIIYRILKSYIYYFLLRKEPFPINEYICIMDIDGKNYRRIAELPVASKLGRDFIHWEK